MQFQKSECIYTQMMIDPNRQKKILGTNHVPRKWISVTTIEAVNVCSLNMYGKA